MAKIKNKRNSGLADKVRNKRQTDVNKKKLNPFEVHINREKIKVLGKKSKHDRGLPGVSRAKAIQKRKETLGTEMKLMNKTNAFIDRRIGEKNSQLSAEDRMIARFAAERAKQHSKKNIFNLADDEILTHRGQTLEQIEKFDDPRSEDEDDEDGRKFGGLGDEFVAEGHFGGGMLRTESKDGAKSHKDLIEQLIAESKKRKAEKQKEKEHTLDLTEKLDSEWKDLQPVVFKRARMEEPKETEIEKALSQTEKKSEDYDKMTRELRFEKRGTPSDALKSLEKQAKEEQEKLEQWEREREYRMMPETNQTKVVQANNKHRSADDLDDNFELDDEKEFMLAYDKDGKPLVPEHILKDYSVPNAKPKFDDGISDTSDEDDESSDDESQKNNDEKHEDITNNEEDKQESEHEEENINGNADDDDESSSDNQDERDEDSVPKIDQVEQAKDIVKEKEKVNKEPKNDFKLNINKKINGSVSKKDNSEEEKSILFQNSDQSSDEDSDSDNESEDQENNGEDSDGMQNLKYSEDVKSDEEMAEMDGEKIGSMFKLESEEGDKLKELLTDKTPSQQAAALQKLIKSYDPSLGEHNKELLSRLFAHLLQYINEVFKNLNEKSEVIKAFSIFDKLVPYIFDLAQLNKVSAKKFLAELLKEKHDKFLKRPKKVPDLDTLILFKLVSLLYPTSDFRHPIATPSLIFMTEILSLSKFNNAYSISRGFFLTALVLEYIVLSKRYVPEAVNFLRGILYISADVSVLNPVQVITPFRLHRDVKLLNLEHDCSKMAVDIKMAASDLVKKEIDSEFKIRTFFTAVLMIREFFDNYSQFQSQDIIFQPHIQLLDRIDLDLYPKKVSSTVQKTIEYMQDSLRNKPYVLMSREKVKPKALRLYEPDVQEVFTGSKSSKLSRDKAERARLQTKLKKEMKGAIREIRRDKAYIAGVKIREKIHSDNIRKEKVKQIYKDASLQQGELNKLKRMK